MDTSSTGQKELARFTVDESQELDLRPWSMAVAKKEALDQEPCQLL